MAVVHALVALIAAYVPLRLACTAVVYCREQGPACRWSRTMDWISRHPNLFPAGRRFLTAPGALCLIAVAASGAARFFV